MAKKSHTKKNNRTKKTGRAEKSEPTYGVMLTNRDLIVLQQAVNERMTALSKSLMKSKGEDHDWQVMEWASDYELNKKLVDATRRTAGCAARTS